MSIGVSIEVVLSSGFRGAEGLCRVWCVELCRS